MLIRIKKLGVLLVLHHTRHPRDGHYLSGPRFNKRIQDEKHLRGLRNLVQHNMHIKYPTNIQWDPCSIRQIGSRRKIRF